MEGGSSYEGEGSKDGLPAGGRVGEAHSRGVGAQAAPGRYRVTVQEKEVEHRFGLRTFLAGFDRHA